MGEMLIQARLLIYIVLLGLTAVSVRAITYNVIAEPFENMNMVVMVDEVPYPLQATFGILFKGEAPPSTIGYYYTYVGDKDNRLSEPFMRPPLKNGELTTLNEFFNRSISEYDIMTLPQVLEPLSSIHRIKSDLHRLNQIPTIHIYGNVSATKLLEDNQLDDIKVKLNVAYISLDNVQLFENVKISLSGRSSRKSPKLSYTVKLSKKSNSTLFGFKNIKLRAFAKDPSYLREYLSHNIIKSFGIPASEFSYVRLFIDNKAVGLYGIVETFQDPWSALEFANGNKTYNSGHMYQGIGGRLAPSTEVKVSDLRYEGTNITNYSLDQYKIKAGKHKKSINSYKNLQEFTRFINESSVTTTSEQEWEKKLDVDGFLRAMVIEDVLGFSDGYMTLANNFYLYSDPNQESKMTFILVDMDKSFGNGLYDLELMLSGNYTQHPGVFFRPLTSKLLAYPNYLNKYKEYILKLIKTIMNPSVMFLYIDSAVDMIQQDVEWDKRLSRNGKMISEPYGEIKSKDFLNLLAKYHPSGIVGHANNSEIPLDFAVNGPYRFETNMDLKGFIKEKSNNVLSFFKLQNETL